MGGARGGGTDDVAARSDSLTLADAATMAPLGAKPKEPHKLHGAGCDLCVDTSPQTPSFGTPKHLQPSNQPP